MQNTRYQVSIVTEHDATGSTVYIRPSENAFRRIPQFLAQSPSPNRARLLTGYTILKPLNYTHVLRCRAERRLAEGDLLKPKPRFKQAM